MSNTIPFFLSQSQRYLLNASSGARRLPAQRGQRTESWGFAALLLFFGLTALLALAGA